MESLSPAHVIINSMAMVAAVRLSIRISSIVDSTVEVGFRGFMFEVEGPRPQ
jgi:hypothetical protein